jgi:uncharacterized damage-inducible protein DinB
MTAHPLARLADRYRFNDRFLDQLTADFEDDDWLHRAGASNHAQWLLGHLASTRRWALRELGKALEEQAWESHFGQGSRSTPQSDDIAPALLREAFVKNGEELREHMASLSAVQAVAPFREFPDGGRTVEDGMAFLHFHESYHLGQVGLLRRALGKPGLI